MFTPTHMPNKKEIIISIVIVQLSVISTFLIYHYAISDSLHFLKSICVCLVIFFCMTIMIQSIFNIFYVWWQRK